MTHKLTPKEVDLMIAVVTSGQMTVSSWDAVAKLGNISTAKYARDTWANIKKKLAADAPKTTGGDDGSGDGGDVASTPTPKKPKKAATPRKRKVKAIEEDDDDDGTEKSLKKTATKRATRTPKKTTKTKSASKVEDEEGESEPIFGVDNLVERESVQKSGNDYGNDDGAEMEGDIVAKVEVDVDEV